MSDENTPNEIYQGFLRQAGSGSETALDRARRIRDINAMNDRAATAQKAYLDRELEGQRKEREKAQAARKAAEAKRAEIAQAEYAALVEREKADYLALKGTLEGFTEYMRMRDVQLLEEIRREREASRPNIKAMWNQMVPEGGARLTPQND